MRLHVLCLTVRGSGSGYRRQRSASASAAYTCPPGYYWEPDGVTVGNDGQVTIPRLDMAIDCGTIVNPNRVTLQRPDTSHHFRFSRYSPLVAAEAAGIKDQADAP
jgi:hypothetical protein